MRTELPGLMVGCHDLINGKPLEKYLVYGKFSMKIMTLLLVLSVSVCQGFCDEIPYAGWLKR